MKKLLILLVSFLIPLGIFAYSSIGSFKGPVTDLADVLTPEQEISLTKELSAFKQQTSSEIAIVTIPSLNSDTIENFAEKLFKEWGIGSAKNDNGVLLLVAVEDRTLRIEVGYGLEGALTDITSSQIIKNDITPRFKQGDYYGGITAGVQKIMEVTRGEYVATKTSSGGGMSGELLQVILFLVVIVGYAIGAFLGKTKSWWFGGVLGASLGPLFVFFVIGSATLIIYALTTIVGLLGGLLFDFLVSRTSTRRHLDTLFHLFLGGGGRGGGGGWGGGGMSGGGGSSGRW